MINCLSTNCAFNKAGTCNSCVVNIEGFDAYITPETYCKSFIENNDAVDMSNSINTQNLSSQNIVCSATNCMYNFASSCKSSSIQITDTNSTCETFKQRSSGYEY